MLEERYIDEQEVEERLWELYLLECERDGVKADLSMFQVWLDERF